MQMQNNNRIRLADLIKQVNKQRTHRKSPEVAMLLSEYKQEIIELHKNGVKPEQIAAALNEVAKLRGLRRKEKTASGKMRWVGVNITVKHVKKIISG